MRTINTGPYRAVKPVLEPPAVKKLRLCYGYARLSAWQARLTGQETAGRATSFSKVLRSGQRIFGVSRSSSTDKTNEIPCVKPLLAELSIKGSVVTADALNTQTKTARYIVEEKGADFVLTVKDNQPTMREDIERQFDFEQQEAERLNKAKGLDEEAFPP
jgi:predicted transposase YbfD/YdcC